MQSHGWLGAEKNDDGDVLDGRTQMNELKMDQQWQMRPNSGAANQTTASGLLFSRLVLWKS